jgi:soluble lytic murein transglycosylase-like protein
MTASAQVRSRKTATLPAPVVSPFRSTRQEMLWRFLPAWIILALVMTILLPNVFAMTFGSVGKSLRSTTAAVEAIIIPTAPQRVIAPLFTDEVKHWADDIRRWSTEYAVDPNLLATVMQIESCGQAGVSSSAGAQGLFQVMPMHFSAGEIYTDPDTNARRSAGVLNECLGYANGDVGLALACYNGGPSVINTPFAYWPNETQRYYTWATGIYNDAQQNLSSSSTLDSWLGAGGVNLCARAAASQSYN